MPDHDFVVGLERVFFSPGVLHKIATVTYPRMLKALEKVIVLQCAARRTVAVGKLKSKRFAEQVKEQKRRQAEAERLRQVRAFRGT